MLMVYSFDTQKWYFFDHPLRSLFVEEQTNTLTAGTATGYVVHLDEGEDDEGEAIAFEAETRDFSGEEGGAVLKFYQWLKVELDTVGDSVGVDFYLDDTRKATHYVVASTRTTKLLPLPQGCLGHRWRVRFRYTGEARIRIYNCGTLYVPLQAA
jgi:hypothetical protein